MLTKVKNNYKSILKHFDFDESVSSADHKKQKLIDKKHKLIEMAKNGEPRPHRKTKEGRALSDYTNKSSFYYCAKFDANIRSLVPLWFIHSDKKKHAIEYSKQKKKNLIRMARNKKPKPKSKTKERQALYDYTGKYSKSYCSKFDKLIRKLAPNWFIPQTQIKKNKLIEMAKNKSPRPSQKTKEGTALCSYTYKNHKSYCPIFDKTIRKLAPNWFIGKSQIANQKKQYLLNLAKNKSPRPSQKTKEGTALCSYTYKNHQSYCPIFDKTIRELAPNWFVSRKQITNHMKQKLIDMANNGEPKPTNKTKEGRALSNYICKGHGSYCPKFEKTIRKEATNWFNKVQIKKNKLIEMAKKGGPRPSQKTKEGSALSSYTCKSGSYCKKFDRKIRKIAPNWFIVKPRLYI
jgi:hypothetical protein